MSIRYKTSSPAGDLISILPGIRQMYRDGKGKAIIYQRLNMPGASYIGAEHPFGNEIGEPTCFNEYMFEMMRPLLISQEYIEDFIIYNGQEFDINLDEVRQQTFTNQPKGQINRWIFYCFPQMSTDLSESWIDVHPIKSSSIIINFTQRHRNPTADFYFLKRHKDKIIFAGLQEEKDLFCNQNDLDVPLLEVKNFYELAARIKGCRFFLGNQSMCFQIAEGLKVPRILELFPAMPNVIPIGKNAFDAYYGQHIEYYFEKLLSK